MNSFLLLTVENQIATILDRKSPPSKKNEYSLKLPSYCKFENISFVNNICRSTYSRISVIIIYKL